MGGIGDIVGAGVSGFASGGGFSKGGFKSGDLLNADNVIQGPAIDFAGRTKFNDLSNLGLKKTKLKF